MIRSTVELPRFRVRYIADPIDPVKHGLVKCVHGWEYSSFHRGVRRGDYDVKWGCQCNDNIFTPAVTSIIDLEMGE